MSTLTDALAPFDAEVVHVGQFDLASVFRERRLRRAQFLQWAEDPRFANVIAHWDTADSLFGGTLDAGTAVDVQSTSGGIQVTRLTARTASRITTGSGPLTISAVSLLPASLLVATTGSGTRTVPLGY